MMNRPNISEKWIKASILGTIWGASEIILGSFLHNLHVPFRGIVLTAIGIIVLISVSQTWRERGLFWRAGIICAFLKTLSPSAVIFGPMIAITAQGFLMEISTRLMGLNFIGFAIGGTLAMSWNLFQKTFNYILAYGFNIVIIYNDLVGYAQKQLNTSYDLFWMPLAVLLIIYMAMGFTAAILGIAIARNASRNPQQHLIGNGTPEPIPAQRQAFGYSVAWLFINIALLIGGLSILSFLGWEFWLVGTILIVALWVVRYQRAMRQLMRPRFWVAFGLITLVSALAFSSFQGLSLWESITIGVQMNFRAAIVVLGFTVLGTELYNPKIRDRLLKTKFRQYSVALELALESLPHLVVSVPPLKEMIRRPYSAAGQIVALANRKLMALRGEGLAPLFIISGEVGEGKTRLAAQLAAELKRQNMPLAGVLLHRLLNGNETTGYNLENISSGIVKPFLSLWDGQQEQKIGKFGILPQGLEHGREALAVSLFKAPAIVIVDEVGALELAGGGWADSLSDLLALNNIILVLCVRTALVNRVIDKWSLQPLEIIRAIESDPKGLINRIINTYRLQPGV